MNTCKVCGYVGDLFPKKGIVCKKCSSKKRMQQHKEMMSDPKRRQAWLEKTRGKRRDFKEKYRRKKAAVPRVDIHQAAVAKKNEKLLEKARTEILMRESIASFVGPRKPGNWIGENAYYLWRTENDPVFYAMELDRAQRYKVRTRDGYKPSIIGWAQMPADVIAARHMLYLISKQLKRRSEYEKH